MRYSDWEQFFISSPLGVLEVCVRQNRLYSVSKLSQKALSGIKSKVSKTVDKNLSYFFSSDSKKFIRQNISPFGRLVKSQIRDYFKGQLKEFDIPLSDRGTVFQKKVWKSLQKIPFGKTKTYGQLALQLKTPKGSRAVGNCCAKNPFLLVVPCHRVLSQKGLGGFALGLKAKKQLLFLERAGTVPNRIASIVSKRDTQA